MRILKTTQTYYPYLRRGGPPVKIRGIAKGLARAGHEVTVLTACLDDAEPDVPLDSDTAMTRSGSWVSHDRGIETVYLPTLLSYRATTLNRGVLKFCKNRLKEFDVVHIYGLYDVIGSAVAWCCRRQGIPYVLEPLGMFGPKIRSQRKKRMYSRIIGNSLFEGAARVIATSENEQRELRAGGIAESKILLRRNGLDLTEFRTLPERGAFRAKLRLDHDRKLVLFLGRLSFIKGLDMLVEAFAQVSGDVTLVLAGPDDDDGCMKRVWSLVDELKLRGRVIESPALFGKQKLEALVDADLFVLPSRYESFGNAAAEAIACATPALVTSECGIAPLIDQKAGLVVPADVVGIQNGLKSLLNDNTLQKRLRDGCVTVAQSLSWDEPVQIMENLYREIQQNSSRSKPQPSDVASSNLEMRTLNSQ